MLAWIYVAYNFNKKKWWILGKYLLYIPLHLGYFFLDKFSQHIFVGLFLYTFLALSGLNYEP